MKAAVGTYVVGRNLRGEFLAWVVACQGNRVRGLRWMATRRRWGTYTVLVPKARLAGVEDLQRFGPIHPTRSPEVDHPVVREMRRQVELPIDPAPEKSTVKISPGADELINSRSDDLPGFQVHFRMTVDEPAGPVLAETLADFIGNRGRSRR